MGDVVNCFICSNIECEKEPDIYNVYTYYKCPTCGRYIIPRGSSFLFEDQFDDKTYHRNTLTKYLFYNKKLNCDAFLGIQQSYEKYIELYPNSQAYFVSKETVANWYPKTLNTQIDLILLFLFKRQLYFGHKMRFLYFDLKDIFFVDAENVVLKNRIADEFRNQIEYILNYLEDLGYINVEYIQPTTLFYWSHPFYITLTPTGLARIEEIQKHQVHNKNVFIAMKFGEETNALREKIKEGLEGYNVRIMDEIEHNHQIVPEMLYEIRNSRFVIAELSNHNNGAYYEAGYALGLGKEVIHICKKSELTNGLHFDVAQVNTIVYDDIEEIPEKLKKRIQATIKYTQTMR